MNPYSINPSFAGTDGKPSLFLTYRKQWVDIEGAPVISNFSFHTPTGKNMGFGINVTNAQRSVLNTTSGYITTSYGISFSKLVRLRFAISGGAAYNGLDVAEIENITDPALQELLLDNNIYLIGNAGLSLQVKHMNFGVSIPNLFGDEYTTNEEFTVGEVKPFENAILFLTNRFYFGDDKYAFEPYLLYRYSDVLPHQFEASGVLHLNHVVWLGGSYKQDFGITAFGGIKLKKLFGLGYAYSIKNTGINEVNSPTHEIQLNLLIGVRGKDREYYSFVDTSKPIHKSKRQLALEQKREEEARKREEEAEQKRLAEEARKEEEAKKAEEAKVAEQQKAEEARLQKLAEEKQLAEQKAEEEKRQEEITKQEEVNNAVEDKPQEEEQKTAPVRKNLVEEQSTDERVVVKRGGHLLELTQGEYVIVGAFNSYEHAEAYSDELFFKGYQTRFGYITGKGYWYVYIYQGSNIDTARQERDKYRKLPLFRKAWVISVQ